MTRTQKIFKAIYYYALMILIISATLYALGLVGSYFRGFTFLFSTEYGWDAVCSFAFLVGMVFAIWCVPLGLYAGLFWLYAHKREVFKQLQLKDYLRKWQFYSPMILLVVIIVGYQMILLADGVISYYAPMDLTANFAESLDGSFFYETKTTEQLQQFAGKSYKMSMDEFVDLIGACGVLPYEELESIITFVQDSRQYNGYYVFVLPEHVGKTKYITVKKVTRWRAKNLIRYEFEREADDSKDSYISFYIMNTSSVDFIHVPENGAVNPIDIEMLVDEK